MVEDQVAQKNASRAGAASVSQELNVDAAKSKALLNSRNWSYQGDLSGKEFANVQQVSDRAYYKKGERWIDSKTSAETAAAPPDRVVEIGSPEFAGLVDQLAANGRLSALSLRGEILMELNGQRVLVR